MKKLALLLPAALLLLMSACGSGAGTQPVTKLAEGNWAVITTSTSSGTQSLIGGNLTQMGSNVSGVMHVLSPCFDLVRNVPFSGTIVGNNLTLTSVAVDSQLFTFSGTLSGSKTLNGTYSVSGGCANGDKGSVSAVYVPSISGTWTGTDEGNIPFTLTLQQEILPTVHGMFAISGTISALNSTACYPGGTLTFAEYERDFEPLGYSALFGNMLALRAPVQSGGTLVVAGTLIHPEQGTTMTVQYMPGDNVGSCAAPVTLNLTKQ